MFGCKRLANTESKHEISTSYVVLTYVHIIVYVIAIRTNGNNLAIITQLTNLESFMTPQKKCSKGIAVGAYKNRIYLILR